VEKAHTADRRKLSGRTSKSSEEGGEERSTRAERDVALFESRTATNRHAAALKSFSFFLFRGAPSEPNVSKKRKRLSPIAREARVDLRGLSIKKGDSWRKRILPRSSRSRRDRRNLLREKRRGLPARGKKEACGRDHARRRSVTGGGKSPCTLGVTVEKRSQCNATKGPELERRAAESWSLTPPAVRREKVPAKRWLPATGKSGGSDRKKNGP